MKKLLTILLATVFIMSLTITGSADTNKLPIVDLKAASATALSGEVDHCDDFIYFTGDIDAISMSHPGFSIFNEEILKKELPTSKIGKISLVGLYLFQNGADSDEEVTLTIDTQTKGLRSGDQPNYSLGLYSEGDGWIEVPSEIIEGKIVTGPWTFAKETPIALMTIDPSNLTESLEPTKSGSECNATFLDGKGANGTEVKALCQKFRNIKNEDFNKVFNSLKKDDLYYDKIKSKDKSVKQENLELIDEMLIRVVSEGFEYPVTLDIPDKYFNKESKIFVFHYDENDTWELVDSTAGSNFVMAEFGDLSPVAIYADKTTLGEPTPEGNTPNGTPDGTPESPVTGDGAAGYALLIGVMALMGMAIVGKKETSK